MVPSDFGHAWSKVTHECETWAGQRLYNRTPYLPLPPASVVHIMKKIFFIIYHVVEL